MNYETMELWNYGTMNICISLEIFNLFLYFVIAQIFIIFSV
jgi:hypothetical protein